MTAAASAPPSTGVRLQTFTSFEDAQAIASEWDDLTAQLNGSLYMTFDWCQVWWRHYGDRRELRLMTVRADAELVGVLPVFIERLGLAFGRARVAKLVGSDSTPVLVEPLVEGGVATEAFTLAIRALFEDDGVDLLHLGPCPATSPQLGAIRQAAADSGAIAETVRDRDSGSHTVFNMPEGFDAYIGSMSKNQRSNYRRNLNKLSSAFLFEVDVVRDGPLLDPELEAFMEMHQAQWRAVGKLGHFDDWPGSRDFSRDLVRTLAPVDQVRLIRLLADGEAVAYYWCFALNGIYYWRLPARVSGEEWDPFSLGRIGLLKMLEVAATEGATTVEAGTGRYAYKESMSAETLPLTSITLCRRGLAPRLRARVALAYGATLHLAYYRVWYLRVAPRVNVLRGSLWRSWIRSRF